MGPEASRQVTDQAQGSLPVGLPARSGYRREKDRSPNEIISPVDSQDGTGASLLMALGAAFFGVWPKFWRSGHGLVVSFPFQV